MSSSLIDIDTTFSSYRTCPSCWPTCCRPCRTSLGTSSYTLLSAPDPLDFTRTLGHNDSYPCGHHHLSPPAVVRIHCGGLGGGTLEGPHPPAFHCTHPRVSGTNVYGPALTPVDQALDDGSGVAAGHTTSLHELAMLMLLTSDPCERWEDLGYGRTAILYRRTQIVLAAARLLPAHRRLLHTSFLSGLWWKLLSLQPARILMCLPFLKRIGNRTNAEGLYSPSEFHVESFI